MRGLHRSLLVSAILCLQGTIAFELPDLNSVFKSYYEKANDLDEVDDVSVKDRVKRQDPGIGDESQLPHLIRSAGIPMKPGTDQINDRYMPTLGNGHLATTVFHDSLFLNGLYTGEGSDSHRARIPARIMSRIKINNVDVENRATRKFILNAKEGYFMETIECDFAFIEHKIYMHKYFIRVLVSDIFWRKRDGVPGGGKLILTYPEFDTTEDINFGENRPHYANFHNTGETGISEDGSGGETVHVFWVDPVEQLPIQGSDRDGNYTVLMAVDRQESNARSEFDEALNVISQGNNGHYRLFEMHKNAWAKVWDKGLIEMEGDIQLAKIVWFSQFYILSSLPSDERDVHQPPPHSEFVYGVARNSLAKGRTDKDYQGHVMWDNEVYILPAIVLFHPNLVKLSLRYRSEMADAARVIAEDMGGKGYKYPFRSAYTGKEVSPSQCMDCENRKIHVSADIAYGIRQYFSATRDRDYLTNPDYNGCDITREIARFYADRAKFDPETGRYNMGNMTGPDESYPNRKNNAYTLVAASLAIHWARYMACMCLRNERDEVPDEWIQIALYLNLPFDNVKRYHAQFEGFDTIANPRINQADAIMLTYPLNWNMSRDIMRHDLEYYEQVTNDDVPAMTWSFFTVGWKWVDETPKMNTFFLKSYQDYLIQPFKIWTEFNERDASDQAMGSVNFLPGMGAFLQSVVYGFAGIRLRPEALEFHNPKPPQGTAQIRLTNLKYLGTSMNIVIDEMKVEIFVNDVNDEYPLILRKNDTTFVEEPLNAGGGYTIDKPQEGFFIYTNQPSSCEHPRDYIYMPWGYSPFVDSSPTLSANIYTFLLVLFFSRHLAS